MPQFDICSFFVQVIYITQAFMLAYLLLKYYVLARVSSILKIRLKLRAYNDKYRIKEGQPNMSKALYSAVLKRCL